MAWNAGKKTDTSTMACTRVNPQGLTNKVKPIKKPLKVFMQKK
jgi:hypothetical protein